MAADDISLSPDWAQALRQHLQNGGTFIASADQLAGAGVLGLPASGMMREAAQFSWTATD